MKVYFWGTRGSIPATTNSKIIREKIAKALEASRGQDLSTPEAIGQFIDSSLPFSIKNTYGNNTPCIEILDSTEDIILCDSGSGIRDFSDTYLKNRNGDERRVFHIFVSHLHWDHIQGFPFFTPAYIPENRIVIHGYHESIPQVFRAQMSPPCFPVPFDQLGANIEFDVKTIGESFRIDDLEIHGIEQNHPGKSFGYRFSIHGKSVVYSTDSEHKEDAYQSDYPFLSFIQDADLMIFDAMYSLADATFNKADWDHSSNVMGVEISSRARVKHLCMFHNEPTASDTDLDEILFNTRMYSDVYHCEHQSIQEDLRFPEIISLAFDGLEIEI